MKLIFLLLFSFSTYANLLVDEVKVYKKKHVMELLYHGHVMKKYKVMLGRGGLKPKREEGDLRVPEGQYILDYKNPQSKFFRSLHISYPNEQDIERAKRDGVEPGGDVMIHGLPNTDSEIIEWLREKAIKIKNKKILSKILPRFDWTQGCIAVSDTEMKEIFDSISTPIPITIYP